MSYPRRQCLALLTGGVCVGVAGCLSDDSDEQLQEQESNGDDDPNEQTDPDDDAGGCHLPSSPTTFDPEGAPIETTQADDDHSCGLAAAVGARDHVIEEMTDDDAEDIAAVNPSSGHPKLQIEAVKSRNGGFARCPDLDPSAVAAVAPTEVTVTPQSDAAPDCTHQIVVEAQTIQEE